mmetsp:Transcript_23511/g.36839  ORF Transcript_23511/g.36839 Transcript_23511/m.36839 type:complete len:696 (+) Transcript_23511:42-2129(+)
MSYGWSYAPTNRATCKGKCKQKIEKGAIRFSTASDDGAGHEMIQYRNIECVTEVQIKNVIAKVGGLDKVSGFENLSKADQAKVLALGTGGAGAASGKAKAKAEPKVEPKAAPKARGAPKAAERKAPKRKAPPPVDEQHKFLDKAKNRDFAGVKAMILENGEFVNVQPAGRWSALHQFAEGGNIEAVKFLLSKGADREVKTKDGKTPLDVAAAECKEILGGEEEAAEEDDDAEEEEDMAEEDEAAEEEEDDEEAEEPEPASSSTAPPPAKKAKVSRPVDSAVPGRDDYSVHGEYSVLLNQTNVGANNNKYYKIQVLQSGSSYFCWTHWGRVGAAGQNKLEPCASVAAAIAGFEKKFKEKSGVHYCNSATHDWSPTVGKYTLVLTDDKEGEGGGDNAPLGKLTPEQIEKGQNVLKKLETALRDDKKSNMKELQDLSSEYYTLIPHDFGFKVPPAISSKDMLEAEEELLKFFMRMGFEEVEKADDGLTPVSGIMAMDLPKSLDIACLNGTKSICANKDIKMSNEKGKQHAVKQSGSPTKKMEAHLYAAIMLYTSNAIYKELNKVLRSEDRTQIKKYFGYLRLLLEALGTLPQQSKTIWRGVGVDLYDDYKKGKEIIWWGASSCTADVNVAKNFMKGCGGKCSLLTIQSKTAADISAITFFGNEKENLLAPGTKLKVLSSERKGNVTEITLAEVGRVLD